MNILLLIEPNDLGELLFDYTKKVSNILDAKIFALNVVNVDGEIPLKKNGEVLDVCTEFDLSGYHAKSSEKRIKLLSVVKSDPNVKLQTKVGNPEKIISHLIEDEKIDLIVSGAKITEGLEDIFSSTFASRILSSTNVPFLTLKCDRDLDRTARIALIGDFTKKPEIRNLGIIKAFQEKLGLGINLYRINTPHDFVNTTEVKENMKSFAEINGLSNVTYEIYNAKTKEDGIEELVMNENIDFLAIGHIVRKGSRLLLNGDLKTDILNHTLAPIYIY